MKHTLRFLFSFRRGVPLPVFMAVAMAAAVALLPTLSFAESIEDKIERLEKRIEELERKLDGKEQEAIEQRMEKIEGRQAELHHSLEEKKAPGLMTQISDKIAIGGLLEVEAFFEDIDDEGDTSDIVLATMELAIDVEINEFVSGHILFLWEEDGTEPVDLDEGYITIASPYGLSLTAGKMYVPFGMFNSHFISDPQTLELGETRESAVLLTYATGPFEISAGAFNGDADEISDSDNEVEDFVVSVVVTPKEGITFGASYISNIADSDIGLAPVLRDDVEGMAAFLSLEMGPFMFEAEYVGATESFEDLDLDGDGDNDGDKPETYNFEVAYAVNDRLEIAVRYEENDEFFDFPEEQYGVAISYSLFEDVTLAFEFLHGEFEDGRDRDAGTAQLAVEF
ncbi:MAG: LbtU family siderophore porin [Thermodesulfobacteriota bacterium]